MQLGPVPRRRARKVNGVELPEAGARGLEAKLGYISCGGQWSSFRSRILAIIRKTMKRKSYPALLDPTIGELGPPFRGQRRPRKMAPVTSIRPPRSPRCPGRRPARGCTRAAPAQPSAPRGCPGASSTPPPRPWAFPSIPRGCRPCTAAAHPPGRRRASRAPRARSPPPTGAARRRRNGRSPPPNTPVGLLSSRIPSAVTSQSTLSAMLTQCTAFPATRATRNVDSERSRAALGALLVRAQNRLPQGGGIGGPCAFDLLEQAAHEPLTRLVAEVRIGHTHQQLSAALDDEDAVLVGAGLGVDGGPFSRAQRARGAAEGAGNRQRRRVLGGEQNDLRHQPPSP